MKPGNIQPWIWQGSGWRSPRGGVNTEFEAHQPIGAEMLQVEDHRRVCMYALQT